MKSKKELLKRLEKKIKELEGESLKCGIEREKAKKETLDAEEYLKKIEDRTRQNSIKYLGFDIYEVEDDLIRSVYQIINS